MLSRRELSRAAALVEARLSGARLARVVQAERFELFLVFESKERDAPREKHALLLSVAPGLGRISLVEEVPPAPKTPGPLAQYLRAWAEATGLRADTFDVVCAGQCWHWFDRARAAAEVTRVLRAHGARTVLDMPVGTGRVAIPLAGEFLITGGDISPAMLAAGMARAEAAGVKNINWLEL